MAGAMMSPPAMTVNMYKSQGPGNSPTQSAFGARLFGAGQLGSGLLWQPSPRGGIVQRRALLIGSQTGLLQGVGNDLDRMSGVLESRGFQIDRLEAQAATRARILLAYNALIEETQSGDAVVVYYSGHGGLAVQSPPQSAPDGNDPPAFQFIVPFDIEESAEGDFRGILNDELSALQALLTAKTENVTTILDCCHSARMSRDPDLLPRARMRVDYVDVAAHARSLPASVRTVAGQVDAGNPLAVRLVACGPEESAFEFTVSGDRRAGLFTESLCRVLADADQVPLAWDAVLRQVRRHVQVLSPAQRPEAEGPSSRLLFSTDRATDSDALPIEVSGWDVSIVGGLVAGVATGDTFVIMPAGSATIDPAHQLAEVTVTDVSAVTANVTTQLTTGVTEVPPDALAFPKTRALQRYPITVTGTGPVADRLRSAVGAATHVRLAGANDEDALAHVEVGDTTITLGDRVGALAVRPVTDPSANVDVVDSLNRLARAAMFRVLQPASAALDASKFDVEVGRVVAGVAQPFPAVGPTAVFVKDKLYIRLRNNDAGRRYFYVFDVGISGALTLVSNADPSGIALDEGRDRVIGADAMGGLHGLELSWPEGIPDTDPRSETIVVVVTSQRQDLSIIQQAGVTVGAPRGDESPLQSLVRQLAGGGVRDLQPETSAVGAQFAVQRIDLTMNPANRPVTEQRAFLRDDRPDLSLRLTRPRGFGAPAPTAVAVRLLDLVVHRNRALRNADVRLDTLIVTGGDGGKPAYQPKTETFPRVRDGERLSMDRLLVYHGPVVDYLDLAFWVSRDRADALQLSALLDSGLNEAGVQDALTTVVALTLAAPQAAVVAASIGATAKIIDLVYRVLSLAVGDAIGLYRTALLAVEQFGVGRHPAVGLLRAQDYSVSYEIVAVQ